MAVSRFAFRVSRFAFRVSRFAFRVSRLGRRRRSRNRVQATRFRFWLWLIRIVGVIVPRRLRRDWHQSRSGTNDHLMCRI